MKTQGTLIQCLLQCLHIIAMLVVSLMVVDVIIAWASNEIWIAVMASAYGVISLVLAFVSAIAGGVK